MIQDKMFFEIGEKSVLKKAQEYAYEYLEKAFNREVYPTADAISNLKYFEEEFPQNSSNTNDILRQLHEYGSPATVAQIGGRYFGFVNGGIVPAGLAARLVSIYRSGSASG